MAVLRNELGVKIGSTTGYTTEIMAKLRVFKLYMNVYKYVLFKGSLTQHTIYWCFINFSLLLLRKVIRRIAM